jgi:phenylacetate-CoA oxygenase PaaI subunit
MPASPTSRAKGATRASESLAGLIARLADNKYFLGRRYAEWCSSAPTLESSVAAAAMAQDELGHARALYPVLKTLLPGDTSEADPETRSAWVRFSMLDRDFAGWPDFVTANFLLDTALSITFEAAQTSTFEPLAGRSRKVLQEERNHWLHGEGWVRRLTRDDSAARAALLASLRATWDEVLCWFGPAGKSDPLATEGVLDATADELRARFLARVAPLITAVKLDLPVATTARGGWRLTRSLPWGRWDTATWRLREEEASDVE